MVVNRNTTPRDQTLSAVYESPHDNAHLPQCLWQMHGTLGDALNLIAAAVSAGDVPADPASCSTAAPHGPLPRHAALIVLPTIGGPKLLGQHIALFDTPAWQLEAPGGVVKPCLERYTGFITLSRPLRLQVARPTLCQSGQVRPSLEALSAVSPGATSLQSHAIGSHTVGFDHGFACVLYRRVGLPPASLVRVSERALTVILPADLPWARFERAFRRRMRQSSLSDLVGTDHGRVHLEMGKAEPAVAQRHTLYPAGGQATRTLDLCALDVASGVDPLMIVIETVLIEHLMFGAVADD